MKPARIFQQYIWIVNTLRKQRLTLKELSDKWVDHEVADGNPLPRSSFNKYRGGILDLFGLVIDCDSTNHYYISNPDEIDEDQTMQWMLSTLTTGLTLRESSAIKDSIILENVPAGEEFLQTIIQAMRSNHRLRMGYQKFGTDGYTKTVCPYAVKRWEQRWYMLALNDENNIRKYALDDRMTLIEQTDETFEMPADFSPEAFFSDYYGRS